MTTPTKRSSSHPQFNGFDLPEANFFRLPKNWTDITYDITSIAELKCVEYVIRHTWGYHEYGISKRITIDEFMNGRQTKDGKRMDRGTGLSKPSVIDGLKRAVEHGYLCEYVNDSDKARVKKSYQLKLKPSAPVEDDPATDPADDQDQPQESRSEHQASTTTESQVDNQDELVENQKAKHLNADVKNLNTGRQETLHRSEIDTSPPGEYISASAKKTYSGNQKPSPRTSGKFKQQLEQLPKLDLEAEQLELYATELQNALNDTGRYRLHYLICERIDYQRLRQIVAEIQDANTAETPAKVYMAEIKGLIPKLIHKQERRGDLAQLQRDKQRLLIGTSMNRKADRQGFGKSDQTAP